MSDITMAEYRANCFRRGRPLQQDALRDQHGPCMGFEDSAAYREYWREEMAEAESRHIIKEIAPTLDRYIEQRLRQMVGTA